jgi:hypothetical protein
MRKKQRRHKANEDDITCIKAQNTQYAHTQMHCSLIIAILGPSWKDNLKILKLEYLSNHLNLALVT